MQRVGAAPKSRPSKRGSTRLHFDIAERYRCRYRSDRVAEMCNNGGMPLGLLGPIGHMHLESADALGMRSLAIGTKAVDALESFESVGGLGDPVLLYASLLEPVSLVATWAGTWGGWQYAVGNGVPPREWRRFRSAVMQGEDREAGHFIAFYLVENLQRLTEPMPLTQLRAWGKEKPLAQNFIPMRPLVVHW